MAQFIDPSVVRKSDMSEREIFRAIRQSIAAEEEAIHLYEAIADSTDDKRVRTVMQDVADEEKVHVSEFQKLLEMLDPGEEEFMSQGEEEVEELVNQMESSANMGDPEEIAAMISDECEYMHDKLI